MTLPAPARRSTRSHEAVLEAAREVAGRRGYGATSIEEIAASAGVGKQTIYRWWPNKAALFIEVYGRLVPSGIVAEDTGDLAGDLAALLAQLSHRYTDTPAGNILSGLIADAQADAAIAAQLREAYVAPRRVIVRTIFARAVARRDIVAPPDLDFVSDLVSGAVWFRLLLGEHRLDTDFARRLIDALLNGVAQPAQPRKRGARHGAS